MKLRTHATLVPWLIAIAMAVLGGGQPAAWQAAHDAGMLLPVLFALVGMVCLFLAVPVLLAALAGGHCYRYTAATCPKQPNWRGRWCGLAPECQHCAASPANRRAPR